jgi:hypothetical protein
MAANEYAQDRYLKCWVCDDASPGVLTQPVTRDLVKCTAITVPGVAPQQLQSEERRDSPDIASYIEGKTLPGDFSLELHAKAPAAKGDLPTFMNLMKSGYGVEKLVLTVLAFGSGAGDTVTVTINGTPTVLTEGVQFTAVTSNAVTATNLAAAIHALAGVSAAAVGAEVHIQRDAGTFGLSVATSDPAFVEKTKARYEMLGAGQEGPSLSLWVGEDTMAHGYRYSKVKTVTWDHSGSGLPKLTVAGVVSNRVFAGVGTLRSGISATPGTGSITIPLTVAHARRIKLGPAASDRIKIKINTEVFLLSAVDYTTGDALGDRAQDGTTAQAHNASDEWSGPAALPGADPDAQDSLIPLTLGSFQKPTGTPRRVRTVQLVLDTGITARTDEAFEPVATGFRRTDPRTVGGSFNAYLQQTIQDFESDVDRQLEETVTIICGSDATQKITHTLPKARMIEPPQGGAEGGERVRTFAFQGLASESPGNDNLVTEFA